MADAQLLDLRKFAAPEFVFGRDASGLAGQYALNLGARRVFLVTDPNLIAAGWAGKVQASLEEAGLSWAMYSDVTPNPRESEVMEGARVYREERCDAIVAVGGGSPMDLAKGVGIVSASKRHILEFEGVDQVDVPGPPLVCVPTTAGSSADVSQFAIITDTARRVKIAIVSKTMVPDASLIDPVMTTTMSLETTTNCGLDALAHAIEAYVSNASSPVTDLFALSALRRIFPTLPAVMRDPQNLNLRGRMMLGSLEAGLAFSNAILGAVHAMAHSLGGLLDVHHGESNAILLRHVIDYNFEHAAERYCDISEALGLDLKGMTMAQRKQALLDAIEGLKRETGATRTLRDFGVMRTDIPTLAEKAMRDPCMITNPRRPTQKDIERLYEQAL
ncbi:alcohol dehydrogenase-like regulatory protein ErcA [Desulfocurvibacter africanus]|uniref:Alcohol dehydrogenase n=1 Tax=Desulfocurvibacter africanus subsp. africanus str. Walvis Bay TaxID=690850 RepID=F3Z1W4_DESAF|nr:alcohol dehydrogenase-like regulatory protein ErcA [Desulfocurvibacter africanus]EGJ50072.1 Alcohol dehydrogenase [Desulfocurvibacter africanus subsp. africanus str. Walvis Bay]